MHKNAARGPAWQFASRGIREHGFDMPNLVVPYLDGVIPVATTPCWRRRDLIDIIDQNIDVTCLFTDLPEQCFNLGIITMITLDRTTFATCFIHQSRGCINGALTVSGGSAGYIYSRTLLTQCDGDALAYSAARAGYDCDLPFQVTHW